MSLTRYPEGSMRELCYLALPLMLSSLSVTTMVFIDRLLLAHYSTAALNAVANAMTLGWAYLFGWMVLTSIAEVFVAQYNGAKLYHKLGEPVWQMIWLSLASFFFFTPLALEVGNWFFPASHQQLERDYLKWMFWFGPTLPLYGALCGFFIGQGKTSLVTCVAIGANLINAGLDYLLIFGKEGWLDPLGVEGAAIATSGSAIFQIVILGAVFLKPSNRRQYGTGEYALRLKPLWQCVRVGLPSAIFVAIELLGWSIFYQMMSQLSDHHITVASISQSLIILCYFFAEAISKATSAIAGNLIGAQRPFQISKVISSGLRLHLLFFGFLVFLFYGCADFVIAYLLPHASPEQLMTLKDSLQFCLFATCFYLLFEGFRLVFAGVLTAAGDTLFLLLGGSLSVWLLLIGPVYYWVLLGQRSIEMAFVICVFYSLSAGLCYFWRFWSGRWKNLALVSIQ
jgi:MATE family multidrug resistance protein